VETRFCRRQPRGLAVTEVPALSDSLAAGTPSQADGSASALNAAAKKKG